MKKGFIFKTIRIVVVIVLAIAIAVLLITLRPKAKRVVREESRRLVGVLSAKAKDVNMIIETYGTVKPREMLKLVAEVQGQIVQLHPSFKEGGFILKEAVLVKIDPRSYQLKVDRRKVQIRQTEADLKRFKKEVENLEVSIDIAASDANLAKKEFFRLKKLLGKKVVAQTTLDKAEQRYLQRVERLQELKNQLALADPQKEKIEAQKDLAKVLLREAELDLERSSIISPYDGWVLEKVVEASQHVINGQTIGRIYNAGKLDVEVRIPVKDLKWLPADIAQNSKPVVEIFFGNKDMSHRYMGRVSRIKARMDEKTRTLPVVVEIEKPSVNAGNLNNLDLRPGMFVTVEIRGKKIEKAYHLPRHVVHGDDVLYIVEENRLRIRSVSVLRRFKNSVFIDKGLSDGDLIIKTPVSDAVDGMQVRLPFEDKQ
ncbi:MAG: efflux RND transporter periplasmic adaptor subunit [Deltaproteobacteria bacterium]|nr:efflux RND transporter periplasmic adaptor subunit [Deltaproteobacteria bacterium]